MAEEKDTEREMDEGSVKGPGEEAMIPSPGSPLASEAELPASAEAASAEAGASEQPVTEESMAEPRDLTPEDIAAMFPTSHADREPPDAGPADEGPSTAAEPSFTVVETQVEVAAQPLVAEASTLTPEMESGMAEMGDAPASAAAEEAVAQAEQLATEAAVAASGETAQPAVAAVAATAVAAGGTEGGVSLGVAAVASDVQLSRNVGPMLASYVRAAELPSDPGLVSMFVPDGRLMTLWLEIDSLENQLTTERGVSEKIALEMVDRLTVARNRLMSSRDRFEDANREVVQVKYRLAQIGRSRPSQHSQMILGYLLLFLVLVILGFLATERLSSYIQDTVTGVSFRLIWQTILWGGIGGLTGAMYGLWRHVADERDYDPQFALWYYTNPIMGIVLGGFTYVLLNMIVLLAKGLPGVLAGGASEPVDTTPSANVISPYLLWFFAWVVGFQQNFVFRLVDRVLKQLVPSEEKQSKSA